MYEVQLEFFEGPLDLLLHLIKKEEIDIYDIPIAKITEQYLEKINSMQKLDLEVASEFLVMASTLIAIKSKLLLPQEKKDFEDEIRDPREELVQHLLEYQKYKNAAEKFKIMAGVHKEYLTRTVDINIWKDFFASENPPLDVELNQLVNAFKEVLKRRSAVSTTKTLEFRKVTIAGQIQFLKKKLQENPSGINFSDIFEESFSVQAVVVTFIALLELAKLQSIVLFQQKSFDEIVICPRQSDGEG